MVDISTASLQVSICRLFVVRIYAFHKLSHLHGSYDRPLMKHEPDTNTREPDIYSPFDSEDDRR